MRSGGLGYELVSLVSEFLLSEQDHRSVLPDVCEMLLKIWGIPFSSMALFRIGNSSLRLDFAEASKLDSQPVHSSDGRRLSGDRRDREALVASLDAEMVEREIAPVPLGRRVTGILSNQGPSAVC